jgi:hypothetical protein
MASAELLVSLSLSFHSEGRTYGASSQRGPLAVLKPMPMRSKQTKKQQEIQPWESDERLLSPPTNLPLRNNTHRWFHKAALFMYPLFRCAPLHRSVTQWRSLPRSHKLPSAPDMTATLMMIIVRLP